MRTQSRLLALAGVLAAVTTVAAAEVFTAPKARVVLSAPDTITAGDTVPVVATAFDAKGQRVTGATITWNAVSPTLPYLKGSGAAVQVSSSDSGAMTVTAMWMDSTNHMIALASKIIAVAPAPAPPIVAMHVSIYGAIGIDPNNGSLLIDSTSFLNLALGDTLKSCLHIVAWTADGHVVTGRHVTLSVSDSTVIKLIPPPDSVAATCPDTTIDPFVYGRARSATLLPIRRS